MESQKSDGSTPASLPAHGEIFSPQQDVPSVADVQHRAEDHLLSVTADQQESSAKPHPPDRARIQTPEHTTAPVVEVSVEQYHALLAAQQKLERDRALAKARRRRYKANHPEKVKEEKRKWAKSPRGKATKAVIQQRYRERQGQ